MLFEVVRTGGAEAISWAIDLQSLRARACEIAGRNLTPDEFAYYRLPGKYISTPCPGLPPESS